MLIAYIKPYEPSVRSRSSNIKNKRYSAIIQDSVTGETRKVDFGDKRYQNYTMHQDKDRRDRYRLRHQNDNINNIYSSGFWSYYLLWNKDSLKKSAADIEKRFHVKVVLN